jgi:hypothetical integral membrane protein (TIGR02206 family)
MPGFERFGAAHVVTMALLAFGAFGIVALGRRPRLQRPTRLALGLVLIALMSLHFWDLGSRRPLRLEDVLPLHLCDMAIVLALVALATRNRRVTELLYFWTVTGTLLAMVTPALHAGFPTLRYVTYFGLHGGVVLSAVLLVFGLGLRPGPGGPLRAWLLTNAYAAFVFAIDVALDENYLFLRAKPARGTLLDAFGPWPVYLGVVEVIALLLFVAAGWLAESSGTRGPASPKRCERRSNRAAQAKIR